mgnify:CR=1 FL=1
MSKDLATECAIVLMGTQINNYVLGDVLEIAGKKFVVVMENGEKTLETKGE